MGLKQSNKRKKRIKDVLSKRQISLTAVFENINDPHNLSACLRSCDAVGIYEVSTIYYGEQAIPKLEKYSSAGTLKWVNVNNYNSISDCFNKLKKKNFNIYTTNLVTDSISLYDLDLTKPTALVFGNEHTGVSKEAVNLADGNFIIPQVGMVKSLNISVATAVSLYEAFRQRTIAGMYKNSEMNDDFLKNIYDEWLKK